MTECSICRLNLDEIETGIVFRDTPDQDRIPGQGDNLIEGTLCGRIRTTAKMIDLQADPLATDSLL
jgi:hypothetical protein